MAEVGWFARFMDRHGLTPFKKMSLFEKLSVLMAFLIFISPFLPWFVTMAFVIIYIPGFFSAFGSIVLVLGFEMIFFVWTRRPMMKGVDNTSIVLFMNLLIFCMSVYMFRSAFFSIAIFGFQIEGRAGTGLYLVIAASIVQFFTVYKLRMERKTLATAEEIEEVVEIPEAVIEVPEARAQTRAASPAPNPALGPIPEPRPEPKTPEPESSSKKGPLTGLFKAFKKKPPSDDAPAEEAPAPAQETKEPEATPAPAKEPKPEPVAKPAPQPQVQHQPTTPPLVAAPGQPSREEMLHWLNRVTKDRKVYEKCPGCDSYNLFEVKKKGKMVFFTCTGCNAEFKMVL
jgi:hypothetical protein